MRNTHTVFCRLARTAVGLGLLVGTLTAGGTASAAGSSDQADANGPGQWVTVTGHDIEVTGSVTGADKKSNTLTNSTTAHYSVTLKSTDHAERRVDGVTFHLPAELDPVPHSATAYRFTDPYTALEWNVTPIVDPVQHTVTFSDPGFYIPGTEGGHLRFTVAFFIPPNSFEVGDAVDIGLTVDVDGLGPQTWDPLGTQFHIRSYEAAPCFLCVDYRETGPNSLPFGSADLGRGDGYGSSPFAPGLAVGSSILGS